MCNRRGNEPSFHSCNDQGKMYNSYLIIYTRSSDTRSVSLTRIRKERASMTEFGKMHKTQDRVCMSMGILTTTPSFVILVSEIKCVPTFLPASHQDLYYLQTLKT